MLKDEEALQTLRNLGRNMAYYLKARKMAEDGGLKKPQVERVIYTNFIR